ncbi:hypothetical protein [Natrialba asiatica]|uniref:hypothetical protein n=1 Tax=Natrialba asiatica TaxID=64602 RepID=UPI00137636C2|nr:hypothetical protein [Natrialba asiatica]
MSQVANPVGTFPSATERVLDALQPKPDRLPFAPKTCLSGSGGSSTPDGGGSSDEDDRAYVEQPAISMHPAATLASAARR